MFASIRNAVSAIVDAIKGVGSFSPACHDTICTQLLIQFYTFGDQYDQRIDNDDGISEFKLSIPFKYFGKTFTALRIHDNGKITFDKGIHYQTPRLFGYAPVAIYHNIIAPFWDDVGRKPDGTVFYRETMDPDLLQSVSTAISKSFFDFKPNSSFIATWDSIARNDKVNSFQCVMATNGYDSFIMFLYAHDELQWTKDYAVTGYYTDNGRFFTTPASRRRKIFIYITQNSNVDIPGTWIFHVNGDILPRFFIHPRNKTHRIKFNPRVVSLTCEAVEASSYIWERKIGRIPHNTAGVNTTTLKFTNIQFEDAGYYRCKAINDVGESYSKYAHINITVKSPMIIFISPDRTDNLTAKNISFNCSALGYNVKYQWRVESGLFPSNVIGVNTSNLVIPEVRSFHENIYTCEASNEGDKVDTRQVHLKVIGLPEVTVMPSSQSVEVTHTAVFTAKAKGIGKEKFTYQWQRKSNKITIFTGSTLVLTNVNLTESGNYICIVTNEYGDTTSDNAHLFVTRNLPIIYRHPIDKVVKLTGVSINISLTCEASVNSSYSWKRQHSNLPLNTAGMNRSVFSFINVTIENNGYYQCVATNGSGSSYSNFAYVSVNASEPIFVKVPSSQNIFLTHYATFQCSATGYNINYKWRIGSGSFPSKVTGINTHTLVIPDVRSSDDNTYTCVASNEGGSVSSHPARLNVTGLPKVTVIPSSQSVEVTHTAMFTTTVSGVGVENFMYQWRQNGTIITGDIGDILMITNVMESDSGDYECIVTNQYDDSDKSNIVVLMVTRVPPVITTHPMDTMVNIVNDTTNVSLSCEADGATSFNWERQSGSFPSNTIGVNTSNFTIIKLQPEDAGNYQCVASNASGSSVSNYAHLFITVIRPRIVTQPKSQSVNLTQTATFTCSATGYNVNYQWTIESPSKVTGISTDTLVILDVRSSDDNTYTCVASNEGGIIPSYPARLIVTGLPEVTVTPLSQSVEVTHIAMFTTTVSGVGVENFMYQWRHNGTNITGKTGNTLMVTNVMESDSGDYECIVTNEYGDSDTSDVVVLMVTRILPVITTHPMDTTVTLVNDTTSVSLRCEADGATSYNWERQSGSIPFSAIGVNTNDLTIINLQPEHAGNYRCVATNASGSSLSNYSQLDVSVSQPEIIVHSTSISAKLTETAKFTCNATGYKVTYQWKTVRHSFPSKVIGIYTNTLVIPNVSSTDEKRYRCVVNNEGGVVKSRYFRLKVTGLPEVTVTPSSQSVEVTHTAMFTTTVSGVGVENFMYQWRHNGTNITGETGDTLMIANVMESDSGDYECIVTNEYGDSDTSYVVVLMVTKTPPVIISHPENMKINLLNHATFVRLACEADGVTSYSWERQFGSIPSGAIGVNTNALTIIRLQSKDAGYYRCVASNASGSSASHYAKLSIIVINPWIQNQPLSQIVNLTQNATFNCSSFGYHVQYKWTIESGSFPSKVTGINTNTLVIPDVRSSDENRYVCVASNEGGIASSHPAKLKVTGLPEVTVTPSSQSVEVTHTAMFTTTVSGVGMENFMYQWRHNGTIIMGETGDTLMITNVMESDSGDYQCIVTNQYDDSNSSNVVVLVVTITPPVIVIHPLATTIKLVNDTTNVSLTCEADGATSYKWERQSGNIPSGAIGVNTNTLAIINIQPEDAGSYRCVATNASGSSVSYYAQLNINVSPPIIVVQPMSQSTNLTQPATITCSATGYNVSYKWAMKSGSFPSKVIGINTNTLVIPDVRSSDENTYICLAINEGGTSPSYPARLLATGLPEVTVIPSSQSVEVTHTAMFTTTVSGAGVENFMYQWRHNGTNITGETGDTLMITNMMEGDSGDYECIVINQYGDSNRSDVVILMVTRTPPLVVIDPMNTTVNLVNDTTSVSLSCEADGAISYNWERQGDNISSGAIGVTTSTLTITNLTPEDVDNYRCVASNASGTSYSSFASLIVIVLPPIVTRHPEDQRIELRSNLSNATLSCKASGYQVTYTWTINELIIDADSLHVINGPILQIFHFKPSDRGRYLCIARNIGGFVSSEHANIIVSVPAPSIITHPTDTSAAAPFSAVFICSAGGYGYLLIKWERLDNTLPDKINTTQVSSAEVTTSTLVIPNVNMNDVGNYFCIVQSGEKTNKSKPAKLTFAGVPVKPMLSISNKEIQLYTSDFNLSIKCLPEQTELNYEWQRNYAKLPDSAHGIYSSQLTIFNLRPKDSGEYRCKLSNSTGTILSEFVAITIKMSKPVIVNHPASIVNVSLYTTVSLSCKTMSYNPATIEWKRVGLDLPITANVTEAKSRHTVTSFLNITRTVGYYAGQYYCVAKNNVGSTSSNYSELIVKVPCPEMIRPPENIRVVPGQIADFYCLALSYSGLLYRWRRYDKHFITNTTTARWLFLRHYTAVQHLFIANVQLSDEGRYCCEAINECGLTKGCAWLDVLRIPKIIEHPSSVKLPGNKKAVEAMNCLATGEGNLNYRWEKYYSSTDSWKAMNITSPKLIFSVITEEDEGVYHCVATSDDGSVVSGNATITIYGPPVINFITNNTVTLEDINVNLTCIATNDANATPLSVVWYNFEDVKLHSVNTIYPVTGQVQSVLLFDPVNRTDSGEYTCHAFNDNDQYTEAKTNLTVEYPPIISITEKSSYLVTMGKKITITCKAEGLPTPTVQWYRNDKVIEDNFLMQDLNVPTNCPHITEYTCVSRNNAGVSERNITVTIHLQAMCQPLPQPRNGRLINLCQDEQTQIAVFICNDGSTRSLICMREKWSSSPPTCLRHV